MSDALGPRDWINFLILIATIVAIIAGPLWAVRLTRLVDENRERRSRQFKIFYELMRTRKAKLSFDHVAALNIVQLEFYSCDKIVSAYRAYIHKLNSPFPQEAAAAQHQIKEWDDAFFDLLSEIGTHLDYRLDKRDLEKFSYAPQGWENDENQNRLFRQLIVQLLQGQRALPISNFAGSGVGKFPPAPETPNNQHTP